jgi:hypothetical protein
MFSWLCGVEFNYDDNDDDDDDDDDDDANNNNYNNSSVQFLFISVLSQQPKDQ